MRNLLFTNRKEAMIRATAVLAFALTFGLSAVFGLAGCTDSMPTQAEEELPSKSAQGTIAKSHGWDVGPSGPVPNELTWANGDLFELLASDDPTPSADPSHEPLWVVAPQDDPHSPQSHGHGDGGYGPRPRGARLARHLQC